MKAGNHSLMQTVLASSKSLFIIPVYQRNYSWSTSHTLRLLQDVEEIITTQPDKNHFLGTLVVQQEPTPSFSADYYLLIDGQQRITTLTLLMLALSKAYPAEQKAIWDSYLINSAYDDHERIKLHPLNADAQQYHALLQDKVAKLDESCAMVSNYRICLRVVTQWAQRYPYQQVANALDKLEVVVISLEKEKDDPQAVFESINSTGLALSKADLIRNYLLMGAPNQQHLYKTYWLPMEARFKGIKNALDHFFFTYLQAQSTAVINKERLYQHFRSTHPETCSKEHIFQRLEKAAALYESLISPTTLYTPAIRHLLQSLRNLDQATIYPFLFHLFGDHERGIIDLPTLEKTLRLVFTYVLRRLVCGVPSNSLKALFSALHERVFRVEKNYDHYYEAVNKFLFTRTSRDRFPAEADFLHHLEHDALYHTPKLCRLILAELENGAGKEIVQVDNMTIEHIMPQTLSKEWAAGITPEDHQTYLHSLGNLTITALNAELSNKSFAEKKALLCQSKAVVLNQDVIAAERWDIPAIQARAQRLARLINSRYSIQPVMAPDIAFEATEIILLDSPERATGTTPISYTYRGVEYPCANYRIMLREMVHRCDEEQPDKLHEMVELTHTTSYRTLKLAYKRDKSHMINPMLVRDGVYAETQGDSPNMLRKIRYILTHYGIPTQEFWVKIKLRTDDSPLR